MKYKTDFYLIKREFGIKTANGANLDSKTNSSATIVDYAAASRNDDVIKLIYDKIVEKEEFFDSIKFANDLNFGEEKSDH